MDCQPNKTPGSAMDYATKRGGKIWVLEHRYYGQSQPIYKYAKGGWNVKNLKYLSSRQALADINDFIAIANGLSK